MLTSVYMEMSYQIQYVITKGDLLYPLKESHKYADVNVLKFAEIID